MAKKRRVDNAGSCFGRPPPSAAAHRLRRGAAIVLFCVADSWFGRPPPMGSPCNTNILRLHFKNLIVKKTFLILLQGF